MALKVGAADVADVKLGAAQVAKVMLGAEQVWPMGSLHDGILALSPWAYWPLDDAASPAVDIIGQKQLTGTAQWRQPAIVAQADAAVTVPAGHYLTFNHPGYASVSDYTILGVFANDHDADLISMGDHVTAQTAEKAGDTYWWLHHNKNQWKQVSGSSAPQLVAFTHSASGSDSHFYSLSSGYHEETPGIDAKMTQIITFGGSSERDGGQTLSHVAIWHRVLTQSELQDLANVV